MEWLLEDGSACILPEPSDIWTHADPKRRRERDFLFARNAPRREDNGPAGASHAPRLSLARRPRRHGPRRMRLGAAHRRLALGGRPRRIPGALPAPLPP